MDAGGWAAAPLTMAVGGFDVDALEGPVDSCSKRARSDEKLAGGSGSSELILAATQWSKRACESELSEARTPSRTDDFFRWGSAASRSFRLFRASYASSHMTAPRLSLFVA